MTTIRTRLLSGYIAMMAVTAVMGLYAATGIERLSSAATGLYDNTVMAAEFAKSVSMRFAKMESALTAALVHGDGGRAENHLNDINRAIAADLDVIEERTVNPKDHLLIAQIRQDLVVWSHLQYEFLSISEVSRPAMLRDILARSGVSMSATEAKIDLLVESVKTQGYLARMEAESTGRRLMVGMAVALAVALAVGIAVTLLLGRNIARPIEAMTAAMTRLAEGAKSVVVPALDRRDEIGRMALAVEVFKRNAIEIERLQAEQREETLVLQRAIVAGVSHAIMAMDKNGIIRSFNPAAERLLGYRSEEVMGIATPAWFCDPAETALAAADVSREHGCAVEPGVEAILAKSRITGGADREFLMIRKNGDRVPVLLSVTALRGKNGEVTGFVAIGMDMSERHKIDRLKNEFVSTVSHELRTPLTSIRGSLGLVSGGMLGQIPTEAAAMVEIAVRNCERLGRLINDILDLEKIEAGKMDFQIASGKLAPVLEQTILSNSAYCRELGIELVCDDKAADAELSVDPDRLLQVMSNFISNAAKFSPPRGVVRVAAERRGSRVRISVTDSGRGIPAEFRDKIFQKFAQADASDSRQKGGTGLGLSISKAIVDRMGGEIGFTSAEGSGTTFYCEFPECGAAPAFAALEGGVRPAILVCEDDPDIAELLRIMLDHAGFDSLIAHTAAEARTLLRRHHFVAMTLDLRLPDTDGLVFFRELRSTAEHRNLPVIVVSVEAAQGRQALSGAAVGIVDWLQKPIDVTRLLRAANQAARIASDHRPRILHIENDPKVVRTTAGVIGDCAAVVAVGTIQEAALRIEAGEKYDLVFLDLELPNNDPAPLLPLLPANVPLIVLSGHDLPATIGAQVASALSTARMADHTLLSTIKSVIGSTEAA